MGYRSEVGIKCEEKAYEMFRKAAKEMHIIPDQLYKTYDECYIMLWECVKWYNTYSDVKVIEAVMNELDEIYETGNKEGYAYHFLRIGEDYDDIEERYNDWIEFFITRTIDVEGYELDDVEF